MSPQPNQLWLSDAVMGLVAFANFAGSYPNAFKAIATALLQSAYRDGQLSVLAQAFEKEGVKEVKVPRHKTQLKQREK